MPGRRTPTRARATAWRMALRAGVAARGHGDDAVPPDDARLQRRADHRGLPRRGCVPPQQGRRALPRPLCAERAGARLARRHLARRADGDRRRSRHRGQRACSTCAISERRGFSNVCTTRGSSRSTFAHVDPDLRADPRSPRCALPHGRHRHGRLGAHRARGPLRRGRGGVRVRSRREPSRRQRAHGDDHLRQAGRPARCRVGRSRTPPWPCRRRSRRTPRASCRRSSTGPTESGPGGSARSSRRRCTRTSVSSAARSRCWSRARSCRALRERYERVVVDDKGEVFNSTSRRRSSSGSCSSSPSAWSWPGSPARRAAAHTRGRTTIRSATTRTSCATRSITWSDGAPSLDWRPVTITKWQPQERTY